MTVTLIYLLTNHGDVYLFQKCNRVTVLWLKSRPLLLRSAEQRHPDGMQRVTCFADTDTC